MKELPGKSQLHAMFYERPIKGHGYRAHVTRIMYDKAAKIVDSARKRSFTCANIEKVNG